ncbi:hypothetical protein [Mariniplasma anaerobium]|uniref:Uncharacterized protein n=1 Tax=Mariniplasma anaerobium TaxID=2735436 RepID=A0A7U9THY7_9MOLU|nr:hypothetical protein [Mariniplasma anaerobium]BCR36861.1 hypothetical protein MPAN_017540 [Mariniplasma anaerobium]
MKLVNRIMFGLIITVGLMLVYSITDEYYRSREIVDIAAEKLENQEYQDLISAAYYDETPVFEQTVTQNDKEFLVLIYQAAHITDTTNGLLVLEGFQLLVVQKSGEMLPEYFDVLVSADSDVEVSYTGFNLYNLGLYSAFDPDTQGSLFLRNYFEKDDVFQTITHITFSKDEVEIFDIEVELTESLYTLKTPLDNYINEYDEVPLTDIDGVSYNAPIIINVRDKVTRNVVIYLVVVLTSYYLLFIRQRKTLGRDKMSEGLKKDVDKLNNAKDSDISA